MNLEDALRNSLDAPEEARLRDDDDALEVAAGRLPKGLDGCEDLSSILLSVIIEKSAQRRVREVGGLVKRVNGQ